MGQSLSTFWFPLHQPVFCICFTNLVHIWSLHALTFLQGFQILFYLFFWLTLLKLKPVCAGVESGLQKLTTPSLPPSPLPPKVSNTQRSEGSLLSPSDSSAVAPHGKYVWCGFFSSFFLCLHIRMWPKLFGLICADEWWACNSMSVRVCAVRARTVELFGILTTVPCWQLL